MTRISLIAAVSKNGVIGKDGGIPWRLSSDLKRFARLTKGHVVIMGRKTYESIIAARGGPLPERTNIVLTRRHDYTASGCIVGYSWNDVLLRAKMAVGDDTEIFVIGGEEIYRLALPHAEKVILTHVDAECDGDAFFPELGEKEWRRIYSDRKDFHKKHPGDEYPYQVSWYERRPKPAAVDMDNSRIPEQRAAMEGIITRGHCPFCPGNLPPEHTQPLLKDGTHWYVTKNQWPHRNTKLNLLFALKRHAETLKDLKPDEGAELFALLSWAENHFAFPGGGIGMRFGNTDFSAATVRHIHVQLFVPDRDNPDYEPVRFKIGKNKS